MRTIVMLVIVSIASLAHAQDAGKDAERARVLYEQGLRHYNLTEYDQAIVVWRESYRLSKAALLLFNIGQAYRLDGDCKTASQFYASYRREAAKPIKNDAEVVAAENLCASQLAQTPAEPPPAVDRKPPAVDRKPPAVDREPPAVDRKPPAVARPLPAARRPSPAPPPSSSSGGRSLRIAGISLSTAGVALIGTSVVFGLRSRSAAAAVAGGSGTWTPELDALEAHGKRDQTIAIAAGASGVAALVAGGTLFMLGRRAATVEVAPSRAGATVAVKVRF